MKAWAILGAAVAMASQAAWADPRPAVIELFTSQGCSSCPPAEAVLGDLAGRRDVIALAFHVDYWNNLGWVDRFSAADFTKRQYAYAKKLGLDSVYTPQVVIDGHEDVVGSDRHQIIADLRAPRAGVPVALRVEGDAVVAAIGTQSIIKADFGARAAEAVLVAYSGTVDTKVNRGENAGQTLREHNIVRALIPLGRWTGEPEELRLPTAKLPDDATHVALLLQEPGQGAVLGAADLPLR